MLDSIGRQGYLYNGVSCPEWPNPPSMRGTVFEIGEAACQTMMKLTSLLFWPSELVR